MGAKARELAPKPYAPSPLMGRAGVGWPKRSVLCGWRLHRHPSLPHQGGGLLPSVEEARHGTLVSDPADRLREQRRDGEDADLGARFGRLVGGDRVGDDELAQRRMI